MAEPSGDLPRSFLGYNRDEVEAKLNAERERLRQAEAEAERLGAKLDDRDRRLKQALEELDRARREAAEKGRAASRLDQLRQSPNFAGVEGDADAEGGITRALEEVYAEVWRGVGRIGERAAVSGGRLVARALTLSGLVDSEQRAGSRSHEAGWKQPVPAGPPMIPGPPPPEAGKVEIDVGPLKDFAQLSAFEDAVAAVAGAEDVNVKKFSGGRATLELLLGEGVDLLAEIERRAPLPVQARSAGASRVTVDVKSDAAAA